MSGTRYILVGSLIDGSGANVRRNVFLTVKESVITDIAPIAELPQNKTTAIDDLSHCTIVPALVDCSVSLSRSPSMDTKTRSSSQEANFAQKAVIFKQHIHHYLAHGVLGIADNDDINDLLDNFNNDKARGCIIDIRLPKRAGKNSDESLLGDNPDGDFLRIDYSNDIDEQESPAPNLCHEDLCNILKHRGERKAVVKANGRQQVEEALVAGCDAIEQGYAMGEDNLRKIAENDVLWIPSALRAKNSLDSSTSGGSVCCRFSQRYIAPGKPLPGAEAHWKKMLNGQLTQLRLARKLGVKTAIGTGAGNIGIIHGESVVEEMKLFIKAGYSLEETIQCASANGARFFGMGNLGTITVGQKANFLITRGTVHQLPRKLSYLEGIYIDGEPSTS